MPNGIIAVLTVASLDYVPGIQMSGIHMVVWYSNHHWNTSLEYKRH